MLGISAMAVQNALVQIALKESPSTCVMTTNTARFVIDLGEVLLGRSRNDGVKAGERAKRTRTRDRRLRRRLWPRRRVSGRHWSVAAGTARWPCAGGARRRRCCQAGRLSGTAAHPGLVQRITGKPSTQGDGRARDPRGL
jgi:hypothetical protein